MQTVQSGLTVAPRLPQAMAFHPETSKNRPEPMPYHVKPTWPASAMRRAMRYLRMTLTSEVDQNRDKPTRHIPRYMLPS